MSESFYLYLTGGDAYLRRRDGYFGRGSIEEVGQWKWSVSDLSSLSFKELDNINWNKRRKLHVYLGSALCKFLVADLPNAAKEQEYPTLAAAQMAHRLGLDVAEWEFTCEADRRNNKLFICASRRAVIERIEILAPELRLELLSLKPFTAGIWNGYTNTVDAALPGNSLIAVENDALTTFTAQAGVLQTINSFYHRGEPDLINREVRRLQLSLGEEHYVAIALPATLRHFVAHHSKKVVEKPDAELLRRSPDFSDIMLSNEIKNALNDEA
jgi:hypothetical protein